MSWLGKATCVKAALAFSIIVIAVIYWWTTQNPTVPKIATNKSNKSTQPNIVFVLADDFGFHDVGYHNSLLRTPNLDRLAASGVKLENYYVQPTCTPTRSQLMSGRYQIHTGLQHGIIWPEQPNGLPLDSPIVAEKLKEAGYSTHMVGKWHLGFYKEAYTPWRRGFDSFFGFLTGREDYYKHSRVFFKDFKKAFLDLRNNSCPTYEGVGRYSTNLFTEKATDIIYSHDISKPMFLYLAYQAVHGPLQVPEHYTTQFDFINNTLKRTYAGMVSAMDEGVGNVTQALKNRGLWNNTIFIFSTDNGAPAGNIGSNFPLLGSKNSMWEGGVRGVGFVAGAGLKNRGTINHELIHVSDWYPTLVRLAGGNLYGTKPLDGFDQWDTISMGAPSKRNILLHNIDVLCKKKGKPLYTDTFDTSVLAALRAGHMKLLTGKQGNTDRQPPHDSLLVDLGETENLPSESKNVWLFNITSDPHELHDLSDEMPEKVRELLQMLAEFSKTAVSPRFPQKDLKSYPAMHGFVWGPWMK